ncbi:MAG: hypothetical protein IJE81_07090 [Oscillospiraceae bacterium]|nr:hypothetical protein [Oscillospiraceae bacterium]MBQ7130226.1 hypothetical protein [Oscillospiraceae bacterium]
MKKWTVLFLALALLLTMTACGGTSAETEEPVQGETTYTVHVVDEAGSPLVGVMVQLCSEVCMVSSTDAEGKALFSAEEDAYKVSILSLPEGYTHSSEQTEYPFEAGSFEMTLVLKQTN